MAEHHVDAEYIKRLRQNLEDFYSPMYQAMRFLDDLYEQRFNLGIKLPKNTPIHMPSTAAATVDHVRDQIRIDNPIVSVEAKGSSERARARATVQSRFGRHALKRMEEGVDVIPMAQVVLDLTLRGASCYKCIFDEELWPTPPDKGAADLDERLEAWKDAKEHAFPFVVRTIDPLALLPAPGGRYPLSYVIEIQERRVIDMWSDYPAWSDPKSKGDKGDPTREVEWVEYWDKEHYIAIADGEEVINKANPYGVVPYVWGFSGLGRRDVTGDPSKLAIGILSKAASEIVAEARVKTAMDALWPYHVWPRLMTTEDPRKLKRKWDLSLAGILHYTGEKPEWLVPPPVNPTMFAFLTEVKSSIERATYASVLEGQRAPGVDYGYLQAQLTGQARLRISPLLQAAELMTGRLLNLLAQQVKALGLTISVFGTFDPKEKSRTVTPSDLDEDILYRVRFDATDPAENDRRLLTGLHPLRAGVLSEQRYMREYEKIDDPDEEMAQILAERAIRRLVEAGAFDQYILQMQQQAEQGQQLGEGREAAQEAIQAVGAGGVPGAPGRPPEIGQPEAPEDTMMNLLQRLGAPGERGPMFTPREGGFPP